MGMLDGKVAIVTGAGHGIGRGHALELAKQGAKVVINDLGGSVKGEGQGRDADLTVDIIKSRGGEAVSNYADVSDYDAAGEMIAQAVDAFGRLDILVNNAGIVRDNSIFNMSPEDFDAVIKVHLRGTWAPCKHAAVHWRALNKETGQKVNGRIINTVSGAGLTGNFGQTNYAPAKAAIASLTRPSALNSSRWALPSTRSGLLLQPVSPGRCPTLRQSSRRTTFPMASGTGWTRRCPHRSSPGSHPTRPTT